MPVDELGPPLASQPTGDPIAVHFTPPQIGDTRTIALSVREVLDSDDIGGRHTGRSDKDAHFRTKVLEIDGDHPSRLQVIGNDVLHVSSDGAEVADPVLLSGTYAIALWKGTVDPWVPAAAAATVEVVSQDPRIDHDMFELARLFAGTLRSMDPLTSLVVRRPLRVGETVSLARDDTRQLLGSELCRRGTSPAECVPMLAGTFTLTCTKAERGEATYELYVDTQDSDPRFGTDILRLRRTVKLELATGAILAKRQVRERRMVYPDKGTDAARATETWLFTLGDAHR